MDQTGSTKAVKVIKMLTFWTDTQIILHFSMKTLQMCVQLHFSIVMLVSAAITLHLIGCNRSLMTLLQFSHSGAPSSGQS